jgi:hypothetical protein
MERNLSVETRPQTLDEFIGATEVIQTIKEQIRQGRIDSTYIISGAPGTGKTSLARAIIKYVNGKLDFYDVNEPDTSELSADVLRETIASSRFNPQWGAYKGIIIDEAHKLRTDVQSLLLKATEEPSYCTIWFICSSEPDKLHPALRRRGSYLVMPGLTGADIGKLICKCTDYVKLSDYSNRWVELASELINQGVTSPGLIIRAAEKWITGVTAAEAARVTETTNVDTFAIARAAAAGRWADAQVLLQAAPTSAAKDIRSKVSSYFKSILLKEKAGTDRASRCVWAIQQMAELANQNQFEDGLIWAATCASIYNICIGQRDYILKKGKECIS